MYNYNDSQGVKYFMILPCGTVSQCVPHCLYVCLLYLKKGTFDSLGLAKIFVNSFFLMRGKTEMLLEQRPDQSVFILLSLHDQTERCGTVL